MGRARGRRKFAESLPMVVALAALSCAPSARAQTPAASAPHWNVDHGEIYCSLARDYGPGNPNFSIRAIPGSTRVDLLVSSRSWRRTPLTHGQSARVALSADSGQPIERFTYAGRLPGAGLVMAFQGLGLDFLDRFARSNQLRLMRREQAVLTLDFPNAGAAVESLRACFVATLADWGIDAAARARLRSLPEPIEWPVGDDDYPIQALQEGAQGTTILRMMVGADGRVSACTVLRTSGSRILDDRACRIYVREGRFRPAIGADGQPVAEVFITTQAWRIVG
jgi:TonB family protein